MKRGVWRSAVDGRISGFSELHASKGTEAHTMALTIQLTPEQEALLHEEALAHGMEARAYAEKLLAERLAEAKPKINFFNPNATTEDIARYNAAARELLRRWREEDDEEEQKETGAFLIHALDEDRFSERKLFPNS